MPSISLNEEAVDRVAKALMDDAGYTWGHATEKFRDGFRHHARIALTAFPADTVNSVEELDALPHGTVIMATGGNWNPQHPELFLKCGYSYAPWMALDPSDRDDGENLESSGAVLRWRCDGEARVIYRPEEGK